MGMGPEVRVPRTGTDVGDSAAGAMLGFIGRETVGRDDFYLAKVLREAGFVEKTFKAG